MFVARVFPSCAKMKKDLKYMGELDVYHVVADDEEEIRRGIIRKSTLGKNWGFRVVGRLKMERKHWKW